MAWVLYYSMLAQCILMLSSNAGMATRPSATSNVPLPIAAVFLYRFPGNPHPRIIHGWELERSGHDFSVEQLRKYHGLFSVFYLPNPACLYPTVPYRARNRCLFGNCRSVRLLV